MNKNLQKWAEENKKLREIVAMFYVWQSTDVQEFLPDDLHDKLLGMFTQKELDDMVGEERDE